MIGTIARTSTLYGRNVMRRCIRNGHFHGGTPGEGMPFNVHSKAWITWNFIWFGVSGFGSPFIICWYMMYKK